MSSPILSKKELITADRAPKAIGPYSAAIRVSPMVFTAGQVGIDRATGELVPGGVEAETRQVLLNLQNVLESTQSSLPNSRLPVQPSRWPGCQKALPLRSKQLPLSLVRPVINPPSRLIRDSGNR
jgi:hypothetical protein